MVHITYLFTGFSILSGIEIAYFIIKTAIGIFQSYCRNLQIKDTVKPGSFQWKCKISFTFLFIHSPTMTSIGKIVQKTLSEFLESSSIHGLVYIASSRNKLGKISWTVITLLGFVAAGYLIYDSFNDWAESPTVTSMETFPISEVPFPEVTVFSSWVKHCSQL